MPEKLVKLGEELSLKHAPHNVHIDIVCRKSFLAGFSACYKELEPFINLAKDFKRKYQCHKNCDCTACVALQKVGIE